MKKIDDLIPTAIPAVRKYLQKDGKVAAEYRGYIASFGTLIMQSGLLPALAFYSPNNKTERQQETGHMLNALKYLLREQYQRSQLTDDTDLAHFAAGMYRDEKMEDFDRLERQLLDASVALKLALRTFKLS